MNLFLIANTAGGGSGAPGMSGGDRIALACVQKWADRGHSVKVFVGKSGSKIFDLSGMKNIETVETSSILIKRFSYAGLFLFEMLALIGGCVRAFQARRQLKSGDIVYSGSDFWPDAIPACLLKLLSRKVTWAAGFYLFVPPPWNKESPYKGIRGIVGFLYWLSQRPMHWIVRAFADKILVTSQPDVVHFVTGRRPGKDIFVVRGGVDLGPSRAYLSSSEVVPFGRKPFDACFIGRFHYQKGVLEIVEIWKRVLRTRRDARLAMIGDGPLMDDVKQALRRSGLEKQVDLFGFKDGDEKYAIFKNSRIVVHPATFDSGGMAAAEAMAWGLPGVSFDLEALRTYYPSGMVKVPPGDLDGFAREIIRLLSDREHYEKMSREAVDLIRREWSWEDRTEAIYSYMTGPT